MEPGRAERKQKLRRETVHCALFTLTIYYLSFFKCSLVGARPKRNILKLFEFLMQVCTGISSS